jgi:hypothetical protein
VSEDWYWLVVIDRNTGEAATDAEPYAAEEAWKVAEYINETQYLDRHAVVVGKRRPSAGDR